MTSEKHLSQNTLQVTAKLQDASRENKQQHFMEFLISPRITRH
jgi:hypothetical protein